ncbi:MAG: hypothetical protein WAU48_12595 [Gammaproteobacteria bacterium]|mgnify:CR=1 FL=1
MRRQLVNMVWGLVVICCAGPLLAADIDADESAATDMTAVIALQGLPCGKVVRAEKKGENDYLASCTDGNRYRVTVNAEGRVVVVKQ